MKYVIQEMGLLRDWIGIVKEQLENEGYELQNMADDKIGILYFTYLKRIIEIKPRRIFKATNFECPQDLQRGLELLEEKIRIGEDLKPYLSKSINTITYKDKMLFDWGIHHFHLGENLDSRGFIDRTGPVLYARCDQDNIYFIQIMDHGNWSDKDLIKIIHNNWPESISNFKVNAESVTTNFSSEEHAALRAANVNALMEVEPGAVYIGPGWGLAASGDSADSVNDYIDTLHRFRNFEKLIKDKPENFIYGGDIPLESDILNFHLVKKDGKYWLHELNNNFFTEINGPR